MPGKKAAKKKIRLRATKTTGGTVAVSDSRIKASRSVASRFATPSKLHARTVESHYRIRRGLNEYVREDLENMGRITFFQRVYVLARNAKEPEPEEGEEQATKRDFRAFFQYTIAQILNTCDEHKLTPDCLNGMYVCMEDYSLLMIEGDHDALNVFFDELSAVHDTLWSESKVFMVDDNIGETYFSGLYYQRSPAINVNEKFPPNTSSDPNLMQMQHQRLRDKIHLLVETFAEFMRLSEDSEIEYTTMLPADPYNKLLPEIQRVELVLKAHKFYRNIADFARTYNRIPIHPDEDTFFWPVPSDYTPLTVFERSHYDVNLTFADYEKPEEHKVESRDPSTQEEH